MSIRARPCHQKNVGRHGVQSGLAAEADLCHVQRFRRDREIASPQRRDKALTGRLLRRVS
jgi:hypothetical protein